MLSATGFAVHEMLEQLGDGRPLRITCCHRAKAQTRVLRSTRLASRCVVIGSAIVLLLAGWRGLFGVCSLSREDPLSLLGPCRCCSRFCSPCRSGIAEH